MNETVYHLEKLSIDLLSMGYPALVAVVLAGIAFSVWYYHDTVPPVSGALKWSLITLRAAAVSLLLFALAEPVLELVRTSETPSKTAVLVDTSSSMNRDGRADEALETVEKIRDSRDAESLVFGFDSEFYPVDDNGLSFNGDGTDIQHAVSEAANNENVRYVVLVSDGRWNLGENPAGADLTENIPVSTVTVGSEDVEQDIAIQRIKTASVGRDGESLEVEILLGSPAAVSGEIPVQIDENGRTLASGTAEFDQTISARANFEIPLSGPGDHTYSVIIDPRDDSEVENNVRLFDVHVLKSTFKVLLAADLPSADLAFLGRLIEADPRYELDVVIDSGVRGALNIPFPEDVSVYDTVIMLNWGGSAVKSQHAVQLSGLIASGTGLWIIGSSPPPVDADAVVDILPLRFDDGAERGRAPGNEEPVYSLRLTDTGKSHFVTAVESAGMRSWSILPPLTSVLPVSEVASEGRVLTETVPESEESDILPVIVTGVYGTGKIVAMPVSGIWRWQLMMEGAGMSGGFYREFVAGTVGWLTSEAGISPLTVTTDRKTYLSGEEIIFDARLYDAVYSPVGGAEITLEIDGDPSSKIILDENSSAVYTGTLRSIGSGDHEFRAVAFLDGRQYAEYNGSFSVQDFSLELLDATVNRELMRVIAAQTGGLNVSPAGIDSVLSRIEPETITGRSESKYNMYLNPLMPILIVLLFTVEWSIRKYRGMI